MGSSKYVPHIEGSSWGAAQSDRGAADYQYYILTIEASGRRHTLRVLVPAQDPSLRDLIQTVRKQVQKLSNP
jgi:hypothetical protein